MEQKIIISYLFLIICELGFIAGVLLSIAIKLSN